MAKVTVFFMTSAGFRGEAGMLGYERDDQKLFDGVIAGARAKHYTQVATIEVKDLDDAWEKTQNDFYENGWGTGDHVVSFQGMADFDGRARSAMVGDIYVFGDEVFLVKSFGFASLINPDVVAGILFDETN